MAELVFKNPEDYKRYVGSDSRSDFFKTYRELREVKEGKDRDRERAAREAAAKRSAKGGGKETPVQGGETSEEEEALYLMLKTGGVGTDGVNSEPITPRRQFLELLESNQQLPWPALLRKGTSPEEISIAGLGLGDDVAVALAEVLPQLPCVRALNVRDNRLTDKSLIPICKAVVSMHQLSSFDLSKNKMDEATEMLQQYLTTKTCGLESLYMSNADIDDTECAVFMKCLHSNISLRTLDLSHNLIGKEESRNCVEPDFYTGGEAIADMLQSNRTVTWLNISWNYICKVSVWEGQSELTQFTARLPPTLDCCSHGSCS